MKLSLLAGTTSKMINIFVQDSSVATGAGLTGLTNASSSLVAYYHREGANASVQIALVSATLGSFTSSGFIVVDGTNMPGVYELGLPNAAIAAGAKWVVVMLKGATNMAPVVLEIELTAVDNQDSVRMGMTALPNAAAAATGGLATVDSSNAVKVQSGTSANQISLSSGLVTLAGVTHTGAVIPTVTTTTTATNLTTNNDKTGYALSAASVQAIWDALTSALTTIGSIGKLIVTNLDALISSRLAPTVAARTLDVSAGGEAGLDWANIGSPTTTVSLSGTTVATVTTTTTATTATNVTTVNGLAAGVITAASIAADAITDAKVAADVTIASVTGAVGSVTGAVGSVTGAVGSVTGAVGSVTGAVGSVTGNVGGNVTGSIGSLATQAKADVNAEADTALLDVGLTAIVTGRVDAAISTRATPAQVNTEADTALADYDAPTHAELTAELATADDATLAAIAALSIPTANAIADATLSRGVSNVQDTADTTSLAALILATFESSASGATWTIRKTGGSTFVVKTLTIDAAADPVIGVT